MRRSHYITSMAAVVLVFVAVAACARAQEESQLTEEQQRLNLESFDIIWATIRDQYWDPEFGGLDWDAVRDELRPKVEQATSMTEARIAMDDMLKRLGKSHCGVIPADVYANLDHPEAGGPMDGETGIDVRVIDGHVLVTGVREGSPADKAGAKPGWEITRIGEDDVAAGIKTLLEKLDDNSWKPSIISGAAQERQRGQIGSTVTQEFLDGEDKPVKLELTLVEAKGNKSMFSNLPPLYVWIDTRTLPGNIGYITFNQFLDPVHVMPVFDKAMESYMDSDGVIIDIRGNSGGLPGMVTGMIAWFVDEDKKLLGTLHLRTIKDPIKLLTNIRVKTYPGPVAVVVDELSASASEFFAGGMKDLGRATIIGKRTMGAAIPGRIDKLPNGDAFIFAQANYVAASGKELEGVGVIPDIEIVPTRKALLAGRDPALEAAIDWIKKRN
jgi:carboxyl-terminal processing protease